MWVWMSVALAGSPDAAAIRVDLDLCKTHLDAHGRFNFSWSDEEVAQLAAGELVKRRERLDGADRVLGAMWSPVSVTDLWLSVMDEEHWGGVEGLIEERLPGSTYADKILYQRFDLPWPFKDRQYVLRIRNNLPLKSASQDRCWERHWELSDRRGAKAEVEDGIWVPVNDGGWYLSQSGGGSLLVYHVRAVIGGGIPDELATQWSLGTLRGMMDDLVDRSQQVRQHYTAEHGPILAPDGTELPRY